MPDRGKGWPYVAIAVVGLAIGFAASSLAYRVGWLRVPHQPFIERIQRELNLTPSQREQVLQIVQDTRLKVENLRHEFQRPRGTQGDDLTRDLGDYDRAFGLTGEA